MATTVKLNADIKNRIQHLADLRQRSAHWIMCEAIRTYIDHEEKKESFKQEALNAWAAYQETNQHLTGDEVQDWLSKWGTAVELPKCHE